jgi:hypothetical protein
LRRVATIILNRNLPEVTDDLSDHLKKHDGDLTDIYIVEAGSDEDKLSKNYSWHADWLSAKQHGLRYGRGMNFGLSQLWKENKFKNYDAFFLLTNDSELDNLPTLAPLMDIMDEHPKLGILSPCSRRWGERILLEKKQIKYFWFIHNNSFLLRRQYIEAICNVHKPDFMNFLFVC